MKGTPDAAHRSTTRPLLGAGKARGHRRPGVDPARGLVTRRPGCQGRGQLEGPGLVERTRNGPTSAALRSSRTSW